MSDSLRDRIANTLYQELSVELPAAIRGADAVIEALGPIPDRSHVDDRNNRWEWCGGEPGTWAWRMTRLGPEPLHTMYPRNPDGREYEPF